MNEGMRIVQVRCELCCGIEFRVVVAVFWNGGEGIGLEVYKLA